MATVAGDDFSSWLGKKLKELNTDDSVFSTYIIGILDGDETLEEKSEALESILSEIIVSLFSVLGLNPGLSVKSAPLVCLG